MVHGAHTHRPRARAITARLRTRTELHRGRDDRRDVRSLARASLQSRGQVRERRNNNNSKCARERDASIRRKRFPMGDRAN